MPYAFHTVQLGPKNGTHSTTDLGLPATYNCALCSFWATVPNGNDVNFTNSTGGAAGFDVELITDQVFVACGNATNQFIGLASAAHAIAPGTMVNLLVSIDGPNNVVQAYLNDAPVALAPSWFHTQPIGRAPGQTLQITGSGYDTSCVGDFWFDGQATFTDLSITANRRKFINADLTPVDLGSNGAAPFGAAPVVFLHCDVGGVAADFVANNGTGGAFNTVLPFGACGVFPAPPAPAEAEVADLWFGSTVGFVDLSVAANRRKFVGLDGSGQFLGSDGARPFGVVPPVFLTRPSSGSAGDTFAANAGLGAAFAIAGGDLATATPGPACSTYRVALDVPPNTPPGADPQIMLSFSDNGGRTFSPLQKWRSLGETGEYEQRLRWLKMGQFRQRQIRLEITDPVRRNLVGFYVDLTEGLD